MGGESMMPTGPLERTPTDNEIDTILNAFEHISQYIDPRKGTISSRGVHDVYRILASLTDYEVWLGYCNLEEVLFDSDQYVTPVQATLFEIFKITYENGIDSL